MRKWIEKILPGYSVLPLILAVSINMLVYFGTSQLRDYLTFHTITTALDEWIPFVAPFILFYVLAYIQWIAINLTRSLQNPLPVTSGLASVVGKNKKNNRQITFAATSP